MRACTLCLAALLAACSTRPRGALPAASASSAGAHGRARRERRRRPRRRSPTLFYDFRTSDAAYFDPYRPFGSVTFGSDPSAHDGYAASLVFAADTPAVGPSGKATELVTKSRHGFGEYRFRVRLATCRRPRIS